MGTVGGSQPCMTVRSIYVLNRLAGGQEISQHAFLNHRNRYGFYAFHIEQVEAGQWLAVRGRLGGIVCHVQPIRQNPGSVSAFEFAGQEIHVPPGVDDGFARDPQVIAQKLRKQLRRRARFEQHRAGIGFSNRSLQQGSDVIGHVRYALLQFGFGGQLVDFQSLNRRPRHGPASRRAPDFRPWHTTSADHPNSAARCPRK